MIIAQVEITFSVAPNYPPSIPTLPDINVVVEQNALYTVPEFPDAEGDAVTYTMQFKNGSALSTETWISFNAATRELSVTPPINSSFLIQVSVFANDGLNPPSEGIIDINVNLPPRENSFVTERGGDFVSLQDSYFTIPNNLFTDESPSTVTYTLTYVNGTATPAWLDMKSPQESASTHFEFSGIYPIKESVSFDFTLTATDSNGLSNSTTITINIQSKVTVLYLLAVCHSTWDTWFGPNVDDWKTCIPGRYLHLSLCLQTCPEGTFPQTSTQTWESRCSQLINLVWHTSWKTWTGFSSTEWTACKNSGSDQYFSHQNVCLSTWPSGYYANATYMNCSQCHSYCTDWFGPSNSQCYSWDIVNRYHQTSPSTWSYLTWTNGAYYNTTNYGCEGCGSTWATCSGPLSNQWTSCALPSFLQSDGTCATWNSLNPGLRYDDQKQSCVEIWGKGYNLGLLECDDGNLLNGDGCSSQCKIETDWSCKGSNAATPSTCVYLVAPKAEFSTLEESTSQGSITFDQKVKLGPIETGDIEIRIEGPFAPYTFSYLIKNETGYIEDEYKQSFKIQFTFTSSLAGGNQGKSFVAKLF